MSIFKFAENILNNLDQSTQSSIQTALHKNEPTSQQTSKNRHQSFSKNDSLPTSQSTSNLKSNSSVPFSYKNTSAKNSSSSLSANWTNRPPSVTASKEDELINFLNDTSDASKPLTKADSKQNLDHKPGDISGKFRTPRNF